MSVYIVAGATAMPEKIITNDYFPINTDEVEQNLMFAGTRERRHCEPDEKASDYLVKASQKLLAEQSLSAEDIGLFLSNATMLDIPFTGVGASWVHELGANPKHIYDIHNTGCTSFVYLAELAKVLMDTQGIQYALLGNVQTAAGKIFAEPQNISKPQSVVPGDGCGVILLSCEPKGLFGEILGVATATHGEFADDMYIERPDGKHWWQPSEKMGIIEFTKQKSMRILSRGNRSVPKRIKEVCEKVGKEVTDINFIISNQPNMTFLRNWREFLQLPEEKQQHSYDRYGNLFGAAMPINLTEALEAGKITKGDLVCVAGFSHAGDYSSAL